MGVRIPSARVGHHRSQYWAIWNAPNTNTAPLAAHAFHDPLGHAHSATIPPAAATVTMPQISRAMRPLRSMLQLSAIGESLLFGPAMRRIAAMIQPSSAKCCPQRAMRQHAGGHARHLQGSIRRWLKMPFYVRWLMRLQEEGALSPDGGAHL